MRMFSHAKKRAFSWIFVFKFRMVLNVWCFSVQPPSSSPEGPADQESELPAPSAGEEKIVERCVNRSNFPCMLSCMNPVWVMMIFFFLLVRILMPPPPPPFVAPAPVTRKRPRDPVTEDSPSLPISAASMGMNFLIS